MKQILVGIAALAMASTAATAQTNSHNPAVKNGSPSHVGAPAKGANSFSENQAKGRFEKAGYTGVSQLKKDANGVWRGTAMRGGKKVAVGLDYKGNVTTR